MALFPPARMGGENVDYGYKGKGSLMHLIVDAQGKPLYATLTGAKGNERTELPNLLTKDSSSNRDCSQKMSQLFKNCQFITLSHTKWPIYVSYKKY